MAEYYITTSVAICSYLGIAGVIECVWEVKNKTLLGPLTLSDDNIWMEEIEIYKRITYYKP